VSARQAGLRYSSDERPGFTRRRHGRGWVYLDAQGRKLRDPSIIERIRSLVIPPAWTDVWICADPDGHLQATGRDARRRKQYRYHPRFRSRRDRAKFDRLIEFARVLPRIRRRVDRDLAIRALTREKVLAAVVRLLELSLIRVGNDEYARLNRSFGLATMKDRHATVRGHSVRFRFRGKSGRQHEVDVRDRRLAAVVRRCQELPGQELFQYLDENGQTVDVQSDDVNDYLRAISGADVTTKDFRIWAATVLALRTLTVLEPGPTEAVIRRNVLEAVRVAAGRLGNTPTVARASYVHPAVLDAYANGHLPKLRRQPAAEAAEAVDGAAERALIDLLEAPLSRDASRGKPGKRSAAPTRRSTDG
jgi:DNA topoisomerase-1